MVAVFFAVFGTQGFAQADPGTAVEAKPFVAGTPVLETPVWTPEPPVLTEEQRAQLEYWTENTSLPGPSLMEDGSTATGGAEPGGESTIAVLPQAPGDATAFVKRFPGPVVPAGDKSNVMESSVAASGLELFHTGNWFAARSADGGVTWTYVNPYSGFPDFCCDQVTSYDTARGILLWLRMGLPDGNGENVFLLSVSADGGQTFWTYTIAPTNIDASWTNNWWDYPHMQLGTDFMYLSWNMFNQSGLSVRTVMIRVDLDNLAAAGPFSGSYLSVTDWFTFVPVQGSQHVMYWASNWPNTAPRNSRLRIYKWPEDSGTISFVTKTITAWTFTGRGDAHCGSPNWMARLDQRVLAGARYFIHSDGIVEGRIPGRAILAWWWNVKEGGNFPMPYIDAAAFYEDTFDTGLTQVGGFLGEPYVWSPDTCFAYPSVAANKSGDLGMVFQYGEGPGWQPNVAYSMADDYTSAPPGWTFYPVQNSNALPSDQQWGDYNTVREYDPSHGVWAAGSHYIPGTTSCTDCSEPIYFVFGRERDQGSLTLWGGPLSSVP
jgi:hypothetical protein